MKTPPTPSHDKLGASRIGPETPSTRILVPLARTDTRPPTRNPRKRERRGGKMK